LKALLLLLTAGKLGKIAISAGSMLISLGAYALIYGWRYAVGFLTMLMVHEFGHFVAAKNRGLNVGLPTFIPFVGAWVALKDQPMNAETEAYVGIAGPMLGSAAAFGCYLIAEYEGERLLFAIAYAGFMLNLFNLIPMTPLDGGRIMAAISPMLWLIGIPLLVAVYVWHPSPMIIVVGILAIPQLWAVLADKSLRASSYYQVPKATRLSYAAQYMALVVFLLILSFETHERLR
jgi:Zn-dependent protease